MRRMFASGPPLFSRTSILPRLQRPEFASAGVLVDYYFLGTCDASADRKGTHCCLTGYRESDPFGMWITPGHEHESSVPGLLRGLVCHRPWHGVPGAAPLEPQPLAEAVSDHRLALAHSDLVASA